ncbi:MAG: hypothetical protein AB8B86_14845 [Pseudomonadales bacterium]
MKTLKLYALATVVGLVAMIGVTGCSEELTHSVEDESKNKELLCGAKGAKLGTLGPHAVCVFEDNRQCSIAAMKNDRCIDHGYKITGYENDQQAYCAVSGYDADISEMKCIVADDTVCSFDEFYLGECP